MSAVPTPDPPEQLGGSRAMALVLTDMTVGDPLDKWLLLAIADTGTLDPASLARYTLIDEADVATRILRLQFETDWLDLLSRRWSR